MIRNRYPSNSGFTLIELMVVVAIVGVLAAIAYPSYQNSVRKARRGDAKASMIELAQWMERYYTENHSYCPESEEEDVVCDAAPIPDALKQSPKGAADGKQFYDISLPISLLTANSYTIIAVPTPGNGQEHDKCGTLTLTSTGVRDIGSGATVTAQDCW
jgi:type IV pilus assembly protein PilE